MNQLVSLSRNLLLASVIALICGCGEKAPPVDDAVRRYVREHPGTTPQVAAVEAVAEYKLFPEHAGDYFAGMDFGYEPVGQAEEPARAKVAGSPHSYTEDEWRGRNTWMMWTGGNHTFLDYLSRDSNGLVDLLRLLDARHVSRRDRFRLMGLVPEPGMKECDGTNAQHGLWIDVSKTGSDYGDGDEPNPYVYGRSSGILGLRLFPNPAFEDGIPPLIPGWSKAGMQSGSSMIPTTTRIPNFSGRFESAWRVRFAMCRTIRSGRPRIPTSQSGKIWRLTSETNIFVSAVYSATICAKTVSFGNF